MLMLNPLQFHEHHAVFPAILKVNLNPIPNKKEISSNDKNLERGESVIIEIIV